MYLRGVKNGGFKNAVYEPLRVVSSQFHSGSFWGRLVPSRACENKTYNYLGGSLEFY